jgi:hypothetical protein
MDHRTAARRTSRESVMWSASRQCNYWIWIQPHTHTRQAQSHAPSSRRAHSFSFLIFLRILFSFFFERFFSFSPLKYTQKHLTLQQICPWDFFPFSLSLSLSFLLLSSFFCCSIYLYSRSRLTFLPLRCIFLSTLLCFSRSSLLFSSLLFSFFFLFCSLCFLLSARGTKGSQSVTCPRCSELPLLHHPPRSLLRLPSPLPPPAHQLPPLRCPQPQAQPQAQPQPLRSQRRGRWS